MVKVRTKSILASGFMLACNGSDLVSDTTQETGALIHETFAQGDGGGKVDIVWVIDDSQSMANNQQDLSTNTAGFITQFAGKSALDYRIGITTTAVYDSGDPSRDVNGGFVSFDGQPPVLSPKLGTQAVVDAFKRNAIVGTSNGTTEQGLEGARLAITNERGHAQNREFVRDGALLSVIIVSDENDQSYAAGPWDVRDPDKADYYAPRYAEWFAGLKSDPSLVHLSMIVPTADGCGAYRGFNYHNALNAAKASGIGTFFTSICDSDWSEVVDHLGKAISGSIHLTFTLSVPADPASVRVFVDDAEIAQGAGTWTFAKDDNAVVFNPASTPPEGAMVEVMYRPAS